MDNIELVHFQLTKNCNLRCWFCGQWGKKGFFSDSCGEPMTKDDWVSAADRLAELPKLPDIILWGGEPLLYPHFEDIAVYLRRKGFELGIVTNGTMIDRHADILKNEFKHIYVSIDGRREIHDKIRGKGVYDKAALGLELLCGTKAKITLMSVASRDNADRRTVNELLKLNCDEILFQDMIALSESEADDYKNMMSAEFNIDAEHINSWVSEEKPPELKNVMRELCAEYGGKVKYISHGEGRPCKSPEAHIHIAWNGNVLYCTDFYDFSAGNVKNEPLGKIFENEKSQKFRKIIEENKCAACRHCSWRMSEHFGI